MSVEFYCPCYACVKARCTADTESTFAGEPQWLIICPNCGKRCPHATDHALGCTRSNDPGQTGSRYR